MKDNQGHAVSGANSASLTAYQAALDQFRCFVGDPVAGADAALQASPDMTMAHLLKAWLHLLGTEPTGLAVARQCCDAAAQLPANDREQRHLHAARLLADGRWQDAGRALEDLSLLYPHDVLALQAGHQIDFFTGHSRMLRDRIARALPAWQPGMPGYHAVLGMAAFGFEETGDYTRAEQHGRRAVALEAHDAWAWHAVAHVMEMQGRRRDGVAWLRQDSAAWSDGNFLAVHNWWHLALFHLGLDEIDEVLALLDERVLGGASSIVLEMIDASALLWRLQLQGIDVGDRWQALAERWVPAVQDSHYAFNDFHAMMALAAAGRDADAERLLQAQTRALEAGGDDDNLQFLRDVGAPASAAVLAFSRGRYDEAVDRLRPVRRHAHRFGGSHAQRDLIDLTLIEAATRGGQRLLAEGLRHERAVRQA